MDIPLAEYKSPASPARLMGAIDSVQVAEGRGTGGGKNEGAYRNSRLAILWRHRSLWVLPLASEMVLLAVAANMALAFGKVMRNESHISDWKWVAGLGAAFVVARIFIAWRELFLPRAVAFLGVALLGGIAVGLLAGVLVPEPWHAAFVGLSTQYRVLAGLPLILFFARMAGVLHAARYSPALRELDLRQKSGGRGMWEDLRRRLEFWMR